MICNAGAGLIYKHYGREVIEQILVSLNVSKDVLEIVFQKVYTNFVLALDAVDNGINQYPPDPVTKQNLEARYQITTSLPSRVGALNPEWNEPDSEEISNARFQDAMKLAGAEFVECVRKTACVWLPARTIVLDAFEQRSAVHSSSAIMVLKQACPWKEHLYEIEQSFNKAGEIKFVLYADQGGSWRVQAVSEKAGSFTNRLSLNKSWWGIRDEQLSSLSGISDCIFVRMRFIFMAFHYRCKWLYWGEQKL